MTREERVFIEADDLREIEFYCTNDRCKARISYPLYKGFNAPNSCPSCSTQWLSPLDSDERKVALYKLFDCLKAIREMKSVPFGLRFRVHTENVS